LATAQTVRFDVAVAKRHAHPSRSGLWFVCIELTFSGRRRPLDKDG